MPKRELTKTLQDLRIELEKINFDNAAHRDKINQSLADVEKKLRDESFMSGDEYLIHEVKESLEHFEETHPNLTSIFTRITDLLAKIGI